MSFLTVVVDDTSQDPTRLKAEKGLSFWLEHQDKNTLFDTGAGEALMPNLKALDLSPNQIDVVVISHGHYDHIGGLAQLLMARGAEGLTTPVFISGQAFTNHLATGPAGIGNVGAPLSLDAYQKMGAKFHFVEGTSRIWPGVAAMCPIERVTDFEKPDPTLFTKKNDRLVPDEMPDDLALVFKGSTGICAMSGCSHSGMFNILLAAKKLTGREPSIFAGGTHIWKA